MTTLDTKIKLITSLLQDFRFKKLPPSLRDSGPDIPATGEKIKKIISRLCLRGNTEKIICLVHTWRDVTGREGAICLRLVVGIYLSRAITATAWWANIGPDSCRLSKPGVLVGVLSVPCCWVMNMQFVPSIWSSNVQGKALGNRRSLSSMSHWFCLTWK